MFLGALTRDVAPEPGAADPFASEVAGYIEQRGKLPPSVKHIVVIRDTPETQPGTLACVSRAMGRRQPRDRRARSPAAALHPDPQATAAAELGPSRVAYRPEDSSAIASPAIRSSEAARVPWT